MVGFCGALDHEGGMVSLDTLKRICGLHGAGSAFIGREYGVLCDGESNLSGDIMPFTVRYNKSLYTVAVVADRRKKGGADLARAVIEGYIEEGEEYINRLDTSYALALYDGRCGELLLAKGHSGDKPLFYTVWNKAIYFSSSIRPLMRLWGGRVRISKKILTSYIDSTPTALPEGLFLDIVPVRAGHRVICSRFGHSDITTLPCVYGGGISTREGNEIPVGGKGDLRRDLTDALFAFDYPQFDCHMPYLLAYLRECGERKLRSVTVQDTALGLGEEYSVERAERLGSYFDVRVRVTPAKNVRVSTRTLKAMSKELDSILGEYLGDGDNVLHKLFTDDYFCRLDGAKPSEEIIRKKALLCQTAMWFQRFDLVLQ